MTKVLIIFLVFIIVILGILFLLAERIKRIRKSKGNDIDAQYINEDGDHLYYDRGAIEKREFARRNPDVKGVRTFGRLFRIRSRE